MSQAPPTLSATYASPTSSPFTITQPIPASTDVTSNNPAAYLSSLRTAAASVQDDINKELTRRMEEDKAREAGSATGGVSIDEAKEEENYGEEVVEDDEEN